MFLQRKTKAAKLTKRTCFIYREPDYVVKVCSKRKATLALLELLVDKVIEIKEGNNDA
jgi:hypothetical protein